MNKCKQRIQSDSSRNGDRHLQSILSNKPRTTAPSSADQSLGAGEIVGISLCILSLVLLVLGLAVAYRYRKVARYRHKSRATREQSQIKEYIDSIPTGKSSGAGSSGSAIKSPQSSMSRSVTSKDTILPKTTARTHNYIDNKGGGYSEA